MPPFENVNVYPLIAAHSELDISNLKTGPIDGKLTVLQGVLKNPQLMPVFACCFVSFWVSMDIQLTEIEARVLGALVEKEITTPEYYPLSLNALVNACNQKSNREPVMNLDDEDGVIAGDAQRWMIWSSPARRTPPIAACASTSIVCRKFSILRGRRLRCFVRAFACAGRKRLGNCAGALSGCIALRS